MKCRYLLIFLILTYYCWACPAQNRVIDSLKQVLTNDRDDTNKVNTLNDFGWELYLENNYPKSDSISRRALQLAQELNFKKGQSTAYRNIGAIDDKIGRYANALKDEVKALEIDELMNNEQGKGYDYENMGNIYDDLDNYPEAMNAFLHSLKIAEGIKNNKGIGNAYSNIGDIYYSQGNYAEALKNQSLALRIYDQIGYKHGLCDAYESLGLINYNTGNYQEALKNHLLSLKIAKEINYKQGEGDAYGNIGDVYESLKNLSEALKYQFKSLVLEEKIGDKHGLCYSYESIGSIFTEEKEYGKARQYYDSALTLSRMIKNKDVLRDTYNDCAALDSTQGNFASAYENYKTYVIYKDSTINEVSTKKIVSEQMTYEFEKKQAEAKAEQDKKDFKQKIITSSVVGGLMLVLVFAGFIFRSLRVTRRQKDLIGKQKELVEEKNKLVEAKNKDILDSITYAKRLQDAILPPLSLVKQYLPESFLIYKPKDIVAGDFYWMERAGDNILVAAADCTGHGVPGALVSVVCSNALNRTVKEFHITEPGKILDKVRELVLETFEKSEGNIQDGMDISLCCINTDTKEAQWSGAYNSLWYFRNGEVTEVPADKQPIGKTDKPEPFNTHNLNLQKGDTLYLFTDGYADQFGGPKGKKFKYKQMQELLLANAGKSMDEQKKILEDALNEWKGSLEQVDDVLVIGIRV